MKIYKYLPQYFAERLVNRGELLFRALSYFRDLEDGGVRQDPYEGILRHKPRDGLEITMVGTGEKRTLLGHFESHVREEDIFVCCFSSVFSAELASTFNADSCVEIMDAIKLVGRVKSGLRLRSAVDKKTVPFGMVQYRNEEQPPLADWALPEKIVMTKRQEYSSQREFRVAFASGNAFGVENVSVQVTEAQAQRRTGRAAYPQHLLRLGNLEALAKVHVFR